MIHDIVCLTVRGGTSWTETSIKTIYSSISAMLEEKETTYLCEQGFSALFCAQLCEG